jgi:exopolysaccharide production protein ExoY
MWPVNAGACLQCQWIEFLGETNVPDVKSPEDSRVTSVLAAFFRRYSIDELPQLIHVVQGKMSFVGPRPLTSGELSKYYGVYAAEVLQLLPGLTGLWQIRGRNRLSYHDRCRLDLFLARHFSLSLYLKVLLSTPTQVLSGRDAC